MTARDPLEPDALRAFAAFAAHRNFTAAAAALHISQPSLHVKVRKLATELGTELYKRQGRRLVLTAAGQRLAAFAADQGRRVDEFLAQLQDKPPALSIATGRGALRWVIAGAIRRVSAEGHPVAIIAADRDGALTALAAGQADVAVIAYDPPPRQVDAVQIASYPQALVIDSRHRLAGRQRLRLADLDGIGLVVIDLALTPAAPPAVLYHGTVERFLAAIHAEGLLPAGRRHVHLSADPQDAAAIGARRGHPVVLHIDAAGMHEAGHAFYRSTGGIWLTSHVPPRWLRPAAPAAGDREGRPPAAP